MTARIKDITIISHAELLHLYHFDFENGKVYWKNPLLRSATKPGMEAGCTWGGPKKWYWRISIKRKSFRRSRAMFYAFYGRPPECLMDHINGDSLDDRISNLREANTKQNIWNTGPFRKRDLPRGVSRHWRCRRYLAQIRHLGKNINLGRFDTPEQAAAVYESKRKELFGEFA